MEMERWAKLGKGDNSHNNQQMSQKLKVLK